MAKLTPDEKQSLREFLKQAPLQQQTAPVLPFSDYLQYLSQLPQEFSPLKPVRFEGAHWLL